MLIGYARTSTVEQDAGLAGQVRDLSAIGCERVFSEQVSSIVVKRAQLEAALEFVREGDTLVVSKPDRLARSMADLLAIVDRLKAKRVALRVLSMDMDTSTPTGELILNVLGAVAQFERALMLERQREGIAKARAEGAYKGRAPTAQRQAAEIITMRAQGVKAQEIADRLGISRASVFAVLKTARGEPDAGG